MLNFIKYNKDISSYLNINTLAYEYTLSFFLLWDEDLDTYIAVEDDILYIELRNYDLFFMPFGKDKAKGLSRLKEHCKSLNVPLKIVFILPEDTKYFKDTELIEDRDSADYVYLRENLSSLVGKKYQAKRNHFSKFIKNYPRYTTEPITKDNAEEIINFTKQWRENQEKITKEMLEEETAIINSFKYFDLLKLVGIMIKVEGKIAAFAIGEILKEKEMAIVHFEKADTTYQGSYAAINKLFVMEYFSDVKYINRQEDMGLYGLRKAKLSYYPEILVEKYRACIK